MKRILFITILFFSFVYNSAIGEEIRGTIVGKVTDTSDVPLVAVNISLPQLERGTTTDEEGYYRIGGLPNGTYTIVFQFIGYATENRNVTIGATATKSVNVVLQQSVLEMQTITVTGTPYTADPLTTSADIDVLAGQEKLRQETSTLGESLDKMAGIATIATGSQVGKPVIRGLCSNRIRILTDGISMDYQQYGVRHWANIDPFSAERIEVVRGASSVLYGSDALGGAINIMPNRIPDALDGHSFVRGKVTSQYFTNNAEILGGLQLEGALGAFGCTGTLIRRSAKDFTVPDVKTAAETGVGTDPKFTGKLDYTDFDQFNGSLGIGYHAGFGKICANYFRWSNDHNFLLPNGKGIGQNLENDVLQVKGLFPLGNNWIVKPKFSYLQNLRQSNKPGSPRDKLPDDIVIDLLIKNYTARLEFEHGKLGPFAGQFGVECMYEDQDTRAIVPLLAAATISNFAGFVFEDAKLGAFTISLGARVDMRSQEAEPNEKLKLPDYDAGETDNVLKQNYTAFSGSIGGNYRFTEKLSLAANAGRGFRAPSIFELHVYGEHGGIAAFQIGDPDLKEETSLYSNISIRWRSPRLQAKVTVYRNAINNYIYLINTGEMFTKPDASQIPIMKSTQGDAELLGADLSVRAQVLPWLQLRGTFETVKGKNVDTDEKLPLLPATKTEGEIRFNQRAWGPTKNLYLSFGVRHSAKKEAAGRYEPFWQFDMNPNFGVASTDAYTLFDLGFGFDSLMAGQLINFNLAVKNLLNKDYRDFLDTYKGYALSPGRNVIFKINFPFGIVQY